MPTSVHALCGGGGDVGGFDAEGYEVLAGVNHLQAAVDTVVLNRPKVQPFVEDVSRIDMLSLPAADVLVGSPICTEAAPAGGHAVRKQKEDPWVATRATAYSLIQYAEVHEPAVIIGENVLRFARWRLFEPWLAMFEAMGYTAKVQTLNAAHVSLPDCPAAPQNRERMVFVLAKKGLDIDTEVRPQAICGECGPVEGVRFWKKSAYRVAGHRIGEYSSSPNKGAYYYICPNGHGRVEPVTMPMLPGIDFGVPMNRVASGHRNGPYADATRRRIQHGLDNHDGEPFAVIYRRNKWSESLSRPLATVTAGGRHHMLVVPGDEMTVDGCDVRMFTDEELAYLQAFPRGWKFVDRFPEVDKPKLRKADAVGPLLIGNAVPSNVAAWIGRRTKYALAA